MNNVQKITSAFQELVEVYGYEAVESAFNGFVSEHKYETRYADTIQLRARVHELVSEGKKPREIAAQLNVTYTRVRACIQRERDNKRWAELRNKTD